MYTIWDTIDNQTYTLYVNRVMDLKVRVYPEDGKYKIYMNYKGFNLTQAMLVWEFELDLNLASIYNVDLVEDSEFGACFVVDERDRQKFLDEMYFFLVDYNMDSVLHEEDRVRWK